MTVDAQARKVRPWAEGGDRVDPEQAPFPVDRATGWTPVFAQRRGAVVHRQVFNQLFREVTGMAAELLAGGAIPEWDGSVGYEHPAFVRHAGTLWVSLMANGPGTDTGGREPGTDQAGTVWREY